MIHTHTANIQTNIVHAVVPSWVLAVLIGVVGGVRLSPLGHRSSSSLSYSLTFFLYAIMITSGLFVHCLFLVECEAAAPSKVGRRRRMRGRQRAKEGGVVLVCLYDCICVCLSVCVSLCLTVSVSVSLSLSPSPSPPPSLSLPGILQYGYTRCQPHLLCGH